MGTSLALDFSAPWLSNIFLLALRLAAVFMMTPILYAISMPVTVRVFVVLGLSLALASGMPATPVPATTAGAFIQAAAAEIALGATLGLGILLAFGAFTVAGHLLDVQIGFGIAQVFDPVSQRQLPILTSAFNQLAVLVFFLVDGHHALLRGISYSLERFPLGGAWMVSDAAGAVLRQVGGLFSLGFALAAPVAFCILLLELALGVVSRNLPQMNMFAIGIPIKIVVGLAALSLWFAGMGAVMNRIYTTIYQTWDQVFSVPASIGVR
jgi:flagellar biosynthesis protein FliR